MNWPSPLGQDLASCSKIQKGRPYHLIMQSHVVTKFNVRNHVYCLLCSQFQITEPCQKLNLRSDCSLFGLRLCITTLTDGTARTIAHWGTTNYLSHKPPGDPSWLSIKLPGLQSASSISDGAFIRMNSVFPWSKWINARFSNLMN